MSRASKLAAILGLAGALSGIPTVLAQDRDDHDEAGVREAIRFEKAKQAAADRQERIEARNSRAGRDRNDNTADRMGTHAKRVPAPAPRKDDQSEPPRQ